MQMNDLNEYWIYFIVPIDLYDLGEDAVEVTKEVTINVSKIASALEESGKTGKQVEIVYWDYSQPQQHHSHWLIVI